MITIEAFKKAFLKPDAVTVKEFYQMPSGGIGFTVHVNCDLVFNPILEHARVLLCSINFSSREITGIIVK